MRYLLPIAIPKDVFLELLRAARKRNMSVELLILEMLEGYLEDSAKARKPVVPAHEEIAGPRAMR